MAEWMVGWMYSPKEWEFFKGILNLEEYFSSF